LIWCFGIHGDDSGHKYRLLSVDDAEPDGIRLARDTRIANVDVVIPCRQVGASQRAQREVEGAGSVAEKSTRTKRGVITTSGVVLQRAITEG
jgi:hypothetical protein